MSKKSVPPESEIYSALEQMGKACPWDTVEIDIHRTPEGKVTFSGILIGNDKLGLPFACSSRQDTIEVVVRDICEKGKTRDPELKVKEKIRDLQLQIDKLLAVTIGLPPYKPGLYLTNGTPEPEPAPQPSKFIDV